MQPQNCVALSQCFLGMRIGFCMKQRQFTLSSVRPPTSRTMVSFAMPFSSLVHVHKKQLATKHNYSQDTVTVSAQTWRLNGESWICHENTQR